MVAMLVPTANARIIHSRCAANARARQPEPAPSAVAKCSTDAATPSSASATVAATKGLRGPSRRIFLVAPEVLRRLVREVDRGAVDQEAGTMIAQ
jgi:hypothetical protein